MKQFLFALLFIASALTSGAQGFIQYSGRVTSFAELRKITGIDSSVVYCLGRDSVGDGFGAFYRMKKGISPAPVDDNLNIIVPSGVSNVAWMRVKNNNIIVNRSTFSGITLQTSYTVNHGLNFTPIKVFLTPASPNAAAPCYVSSITATTFTVTFLTVPVLGTNNITFDWMAFKNF